MRKRFVAAFVVALCLFAGSVHADPYTGYFTAVHDKVVALRDALVDPLTKASAKRKALLVKIVAAMDSVSPSLEHDLQTAKSVALAAAGPLRDDPALPGIVLTLLTSLEFDLKAQIQTLSSRVDALPGSKSKTRAQRLLAKLQAPLAAADAAALVSNVKTLAARLVAAAHGAGALAAALATAESGGASSCGAIPDSGASLSVTGAGYRETIAQAASPASVGDPFDTALQIHSGSLFLIVYIRRAPADIHAHAGSITGGYVGYSDGARSWSSDPAGTVEVVEETPTRVKLCISAVISKENDEVPAEVTVKGYVVFTRP